MNLIELTDLISVQVEDIGNTKIPLRLKMHQVNAVQSYLANLVANAEADIVSATITMTPVSDGVSLPADFLRARDINVNEIPVEIIQPAQRYMFEDVVGDWPAGCGAYFAYFRGNKIFFYEGMIGGSDVSFTYTRRLPRLHRGRPQAIGSTSITLADEALIGRVETSDDYYNHATIMIVSGTGSGQEREVTDYVGSTKVATVAEWDVTPDTSSIYEIKCELPEDPDFHVLLCDIVSDKLGKGKGNRQVYDDLEMKLGQLSSRNSQNGWLIL